MCPCWSVKKPWKLWTMPLPYPGLVLFLKPWRTYLYRGPTQCLLHFKRTFAPRLH